MTELQKIEVRQSEVRTELRKIGSKAELDNEDQAQLNSLKTELETLEKRYQALQLAGGDPKPEESETRADQAAELIGRCEIRNYLTAAAQGQSVKGAERELAEELKLPSGEGGVKIPWEVLEGRAEEKRADAATTAPPSGSTMQRPILERIFAGSLSAFMGYDMLSVTSGTLTIPRLATGQTAVFKAKGDTHEATAATFGSVTLSPKRLTARYIFRIEDLALNPDLESALRRDLNDAVAFALDNSVINGDGTAPNPTGLVEAITDATPATATTWAAYLMELVSGVDGIYATSAADLNVAVGVDTYHKLSATANTNADLTAEMFARQSLKGFRASALLPAAASSLQTGIACKAGRMTQKAALATWGGGVELIRDPYSRAGQGEVALTVICLHDHAVIRSDAFKELSFKVS